MTYMLDTNICIYAMKNKPEHVLQRLKKELNTPAASTAIPKQIISAIAVTAALQIRVLFVPIASILSSLI